MAVSSWSGARTGDLVRVWGYPDKVIRMGNGHRLYLYRSVNRGSYPQFVNPGYTTVDTSNGQTVVTTMPTTVSGGGSYDLRCKTWFEVNSSNRVVNTSFRGNNCVGTDAFVTRFGRGVKPRN